MLFEKQVKKAAREIVSKPWLLKKFILVDKRVEADIAHTIADKYGLYRYQTYNNVHFSFVLESSPKMELQYIYKCCAPFFIIEITKIIITYIDEDSENNYWWLFKKI